MSLLTAFDDYRAFQPGPDVAVRCGRAAGAPAEVLVIDPDPAAAEDAALHMLRSAGLGVQITTSLSAAIEVLEQGAIGLVLTELHAEDPRESFDSLRRLVQLTTAPVVIRSDRAGPLDCVTALELGAADCLARSTHPLELLARVRARLRGARVGAAAPFESALAPNSWIFNERASTVLSWSGRRVALYRAASSLLRRLCSRPREPLNRLELVELLAEGAQRVAPRTVDVAISRLRRQLQPCDDGARLIRTVPSNGWVLDADVQAADGRMLLRG